MGPGDRLFVKGLLVVAGAVGLCVVLGRPKDEPWIPAASAVQHFGEFADQRVMLSGRLVPGSLKEHFGRCGFDFELASEGGHDNVRDRFAGALTARG